MQLLLVSKDSNSACVKLETRDCYACENWRGQGFPAGTFGGYIRCMACQGTGRGVRGGKNGCRTCFGRDTELNRDPDRQTLACDTCQGSAKVRETVTDFVSDELLAQLMEHISWRFVDQSRPADFLERSIGLGFGSVIDYGGWRNLDSYCLEQEAKKLLKGSQLCKWMRGEPSVDDLVTIDLRRVVVTNNDGFSVL
jgi:hypothetical protein